MNYQESKQILQSIKAAKKILISSHIKPDEDSTGSIIALNLALNKIGISSDLFCRDRAPEYLAFLPKAQKIKVVDYRNFDFSKYDLMIILDSSAWGMVVGSELKDKLPDISTIVIDHHASNNRYGKLNLLDIQATSVCEIVYKVLTDWKIKLDEDIANNLLAGITGDTGSFRYPFVTSETFEIAAKLMKAGADREEIIYNLFFSIEFNELKYLSEALRVATFDEKNKIVWAAIPYEKYLKLGKPEGSGFAGAFFQGIKGTKIGIFMVETEKGKLEVSFRARDKVDVSKISTSLGGGGHKKAAGVSIYGMTFSDAVEHVLTTARKYVR